MIAFDSVSSSEVNATSLTFAHTCTGSNRILFVGVAAEQGTGDSITGVTYNGVAMTQIDNLANVNTSLNYRIYLYYLVAPATGSNNVVVSGDETLNIRGIATSYTGALQTDQPDATNKSTSNTADLSIATTVVSSGSWIVSIGQGFGVIPDAGTGLTSRGSLSNTRMGDSNGALSSGSNTIHWTRGAAEDLAGITASFKPVPSAAVVNNGYFQFL